MFQPSISAEFEIVHNMYHNWNNMQVPTPSISSFWNTGFNNMQVIDNKIHQMHSSKFFIWLISSDAQAKSKSCPDPRWCSK